MAHPNGIATLLAALLVLSASGCDDTKIELACESEPLVIEGFSTGFARCGSLLHRFEQRSCPVFEHQAPSACAGEQEPACLVDADCDELPFGLCDLGESGRCGCTYGCAEDSDCEDGSICLCGQPHGRCVRAACVSDADCPRQGSLCAEAPTLVCDPGSRSELACLTERDECLDDGDCSEPTMRCVLGHDLVRYCSLPEACPE